MSHLLAVAFALIFAANLVMTLVSVIGIGMAILEISPVLIVPVTLAAVALVAVRFRSREPLTIRSHS
jgi:hypothetical protein